jgi:predicted sugar kinase
VYDFAVLYFELEILEMNTIEQKIARKEAELNRLKEQSRKLENGQKIITGGMMLSIARKDTQRAKTLLEDINREVTKKTDLDRMKSVIDELEAIISEANKTAYNNQQSAAY